MRILYSVLLLLFVALLTVRPAHAVGSVAIPPTYSNCYAGGSFDPATTLSACLSANNVKFNAYVASRGPSYSSSGCSVGTTSGSTVFISCTQTVVSNGTALTSNYGNIVKTAGTSCPPNSTLNAGACNCNNGFSPDSSATSCIPDCVSPEVRLAPLTWLVPANFKFCFSAILSAKTCRSAYDLAMEKVRLINSAS